MVLGKPILQNQVNVKIGLMQTAMIKKYTFNRAIFTFKSIVELVHVKVEACSELLLIVVGHLTRSTEECYGKN